MSMLDDIAALAARIEALELGAPPADIATQTSEIAAVRDRVTALETLIGHPAEGAS